MDICIYILPPIFMNFLIILLSQNSSTFRGRKQIRKSEFKDDNNTIKGNFTSQSISRVRVYPLNYEIKRFFISVSSMVPKNSFKTQ